MAAAGPALSWLSRGSNTQMVRSLAVASAEGQALSRIPQVEARELSQKK